MIEKKNKKKYFEIQRIYIKDLSFESPNTPHSFNITWEPEIECNVNVTSREIQKKSYEVILQIKIEVKVKHDLIFLCNLDQSGMFFIDNLDQFNLEHCLYSYCPNILFPYARSCISNLVSSASFPQLNLAPINFDAMYENYIQSRKK